jgi:Tol biopolymer transport system component
MKAWDWEWAIYRTEIQKGTMIPVIPPNEVSDVWGHCWSPDGRSIYYLNATAVTKGSVILNNRILEHNLETGREREIAAFESVNSSHGLFEISPDGGKLVFIQRESADEKDIINIISVAGGAPQKIYILDLNKETVEHLVWTPDGHFIVCSVRDRPSGKCELIRVPAEGGQPQKMGLSMYGISQLSIRPDGRQIAFSSSGPIKRMPEIWVMKNFLPEEKGQKDSR